MRCSKLSEKLLIEEAKRRATIFSKLTYYLKIIVNTAKRLDSNAEVYLFGSVALGNYLLSSDIDILIVTNLLPELVISKLWEEGIEDPFEIHVINKDLIGLYRKRSKLINVEGLINQKE